MFPAYLRSKIVILTALSLELMIVLGGLTATQAQSAISATAEHRRQQPRLSFSFVPPEDDQQPQTNQAGGRRHQLCNTSTPGPLLTLLMPSTNQGLTTSAHPTFWVYIPPTTAQSVFLKLEDEHNNYHYHTVLPISETAGIRGFTLPETAPALEMDKTLKVSLAIMCGSMLDPSDPVVEGWIKRVAPDTSLSPQHEQRTALELAAFYVNQGIWFDALTILANLRQSQPHQETFDFAWEELLESVGLEALKDTTVLSPVQQDVS